MIASRRNDPTQSNRSSVWNHDCQGAFDVLTRCLMSASVLAMTNDEDRLILDTGASDWAIGTVLSEIRDEFE